MSWFSTTRTDQLNKNDKKNMISWSSKKYYLIGKGIENAYLYFHCRVCYYLQCSFSLSHSQLCLKQVDVWKCCNPLIFFACFGHSWLILPSPSVRISPTWSMQLTQQLNARIIMWRSKPSSPDVLVLLITFRNRQITSRNTLEFQTKWPLPWPPWPHRETLTLILTKKID